MRLILLALAISATAYVYLLFRVSAFRKDRNTDNRHFGNPLQGFPFISLADVLAPGTYHEPGRRLLPWLYLSLVLLALTAFAAIAVLIDRL